MISIMHVRVLFTYSYSTVVSVSVQTCWRQFLIWSCCCLIECHIRGKRVSLEGALPVATAAAGPNSVLLRIQADDPKTRIETHVHKVGRNPCPQGREGT